MKKPALTLLAVAVPLALLLALWLSFGGSERTGGSASPAPAGSSAQAPSPAPVELAAPELARASAPFPAAPEPSTVPAQTDERRALASDASGRRIAGQVEIPQGSPADETLRILAMSEPTSAREFYGQGGLLADLAEGKKRSVVGTAPVAGDGRFELALGSSAEVWLLLDGRFLFSPRAAHVPAGERGAPLVAELGGCLRGRVRLPEGVGEAHALYEQLELELGPDDQNFSMNSLGTAPLFGRAGSVDGEGRFELRALPPGHAHSLEVQAEDLADSKVDGLTFEAGAVREIEIVLQRGATLRGLVRDEGGNPVPLATVAAAESGMWGFPGSQLASAETDASGAFTLAHVAPGKCLLIAKKDGHLDSEAVKLELGDEEQREGLALELAQGASIAGRVRLPDGAAVPGAEVEVSFDPEALVGMGAFNAARGAKGQTESDADGAFAVSGLGKGPFLVRASLERAAVDGSKDTWQAKLSGVQPDTRELELTLAPPSSVSGRVRAADGAPVPEFALVATQDGGSVFLPGESQDQDCKDPEGAFVLRGLAAGKWRIEARADGFGPMTPVAVTLPGSDEPLELVLAPAASIAGSVVDPKGAPLSGARVTLQIDPAQRMQRMRGNQPMPETSSGDGGAFLLTGLGAGTVAIVAAHEGFAPSEPASVETSAESPARGVVLTLRRGGLITGEVFGADGKPAGGTQILAQGAGSFETNMRRTDGGGLFRFEHLAPGTWTITALLQGAEVDTAGTASETTATFLENMRFTMIELEDGAEKHVVLGAPPKDPVLVRGRVQHGERGVEGGIVTFMAEGAKGLEALKMAPLGADGVYETRLDAPGAYVVTVQITADGSSFQQNNVEYRETIPEAAQHRLDFLLPLGSVRGMVQGADRRPLAGARVTLATEGGIETGSMLGGHYSESTTDESGHYSFEYLRPGVYAVAAGGALFGGAFGSKTQVGRLVRAPLRVEEGRALEGVDFQLEEPGDITGRVVDAGGAPVKDAALFVRDSSGRLLDRFSMITSAADGSFAYTGVAAGEYLVSARVKGLASQESVPLRVEKGGSASVELVLHAGTRLEIEVLDAEGEPVRARISVLDAQGREMQGMLGWSELASGFSSGFDGKKQVVGPLPVGSYTVVAIAPGGEKTSKPVTLDGQPERKLKLRLR